MPDPAELLRILLRIIHRTIGLADSRSGAILNTAERDWRRVTRCGPAAAAIRPAAPPSTGAVGQSAGRARAPRLPAAAWTDSASTRA